MVRFWIFVGDELHALDHGDPRLHRQALDEGLARGVGLLKLHLHVVDGRRLRGLRIPGGGGEIFLHAIDPHAVDVEVHIANDGVVAAMKPVVELAESEALGSARGAGSRRCRASVAFKGEVVLECALLEVVTEMS